MEKRKLGFTDLYLTTIGLGAWAIGGSWEYGWGPQDEKESVETIHRALDLGINWIDTAPAYGLGVSEKAVGKALAGKRDQVIVATKCGQVWNEGDRGVHRRLKADSVRKEAEDSLRRLKVDVIDLYQVHWPDPDEDLEEGWQAIAGLVKEGKVRYAGASNFSVAQLRRVQVIHPVASLQPPYNLLRREVEAELLGYCDRHAIGVVVYSPMASGVLTEAYSRARAEQLAEDDWRRRSLDFNEPGLTTNLVLLEKLRTIAQAEGRTVAQLAIAWVLRRPEVTAAIVGARRPVQVDELVPAAAWRLLPEQIVDIDELLEEWRREYPRA
jgi:aryl-alcohol dehydrogenase-like predicted oxidoreductase